MRILFVTMSNFENNSSVTIQNKGIIKGLVSIGNNVDTLTLTPNENTLNYDAYINDIKSIVNNTFYLKLSSQYALLSAKKPKDINEKSYRLQSRILNSIFMKTRFLLKKAHENISIFDAQKVNVKNVSKLTIDYNKYDVIISASDPKSSHLLVERIFKKSNCRAQWIQYWGDPMLMDITRKKDWRNWLVKHHEKKLIKKANKVIYASPLTLKVQKKIFPKLSHKMDYANQVFVKNIEVTSGSEEINNSDISILKVGYFGDYRSTVRNIKPLLKAIMQIENTELNICGPSDINIEGTSNIKVHGTVSYNKVLNMEMDSDILVCICNSKGTQIPGKIYYCAGYNKPIIVVLDSENTNELRDYFQLFNRFILCENKEEDIKRAIENARLEVGNKIYSKSECLTPAFMAEKILSVKV